MSDETKQPKQIPFPTLLPGDLTPVSVTLGPAGGTVGPLSPFEAAVWLLLTYATPAQVQQVRGEVGRAILTAVPVETHVGPAWWKQPT